MDWNTNNYNKSNNAKRKIAPSHSIADPQNSDCNKDTKDENYFLFLPELSAFNGAAKNITPKDAESLIAKQMNALTVDERQQAYEDLHGVSQVIPETPEFVAKSIEQLQRELDKIKNKQAYEKALIQGPNYVNTKRFKLMFLRSTFFDARKTALRIIRHFEEKLCWFGEEKLGRPIVIADMGSEEMKIINSGFFQILPFRDRAGRRITWSTPLGNIKINATSLARAIWYIIMTLLETDEETQIRGLIGVYYSTDCFALDHIERTHAYVTSRLEPAFPDRVAGMHFCLKDPKMAKLVSLFNFVLGSHINCRCRIHQGCDTEIQYKLMTFGINQETLPITNSGVAKIKFHKEWIQRQKLREQKFPYLLYDDQHDRPQQQQQYIIRTFRVGGSLAIIDYPGHYDVMLGRGRPCQKHSGNIRMLEMVESVRNEMDMAPRGGKKAIQERIFNDIHELGGRFLEQQKEGWWIEVSKEVALHKISHSYRNNSLEQRERRGC